MIERNLTSDEVVLAQATKAAVQAAGGLEICERETGKSDTQLSRCCTRNHRDSLTIRDAAIIDGLRQSGEPQILHALARIAGGVFILLPEARVDATGLQLCVLELSAELGDVAATVRDAVASSSAGGTEVEAAEREAILAQLDDLDRASARLRHHLKPAAGEGGATST
jgi:hypothetical protein